jgi:hypothetical protein
MAKQTKQEEQYRKLMADTSQWYAACEGASGLHPFWSGPYRSSYSDAFSDARAHDTAAHGGDSTASVFPVP